MLDNETKRRIDSARDILVGKLPDPKSQVEQITIALIYKFMDDMDAQAVEYGGDPSFFVGEYDKYGWRKLFAPSLGGHERLALYGEAIVKLNQNPNLPQLFRDIFKNAFLPYRDPETLTLFLKTINEFRYDHSEMLGDAFEYLLSVLGSQGDAGQFRTPRHIIDFIVEVLEPKKNETICDPACGTAGFLISSYKHILNNNQRTTPGDLLTPDERKQMMTNFAGYDISPDMVRLSLVNLYLHGFPNPSVIEYDTLTSEDRWNENFDIILANPPFMSPKGGIKPHKKFSISANRSEVLFVDYIAEHIHPTHGRAGVIVPEGIIFQSATAYKDLRKMLVDKQYLYAVVSLPAGVFNPYSGVKTSILLMDRTLAQKTDKILFVKIANDGFGLGAQRKELATSNLPDALNVIRDFGQAILQGDTSRFEIEDANLQAVAIEKTKIAENGDYNLSGDRYKTDKVQIHNYEVVSLGEVCNIYNGSTPSRTNQDYWENGTINWFTIDDIREQGRVIRKTKQKITEKGFNESSVKLLPPETVLLCCTASVGEYGFTEIPLTTNQQFNGLVINETFKEKLSSKFLFHLTSTFENDLKKLGGTTSFKFISVKDLKTIKIPLPPLSIQKEIVEKIEGFQRIIDGAKQVVENYKPQIDISPDWKMVELGEVGENLDNRRKPVTSSDRVKGIYPYYGASGIVDYVDNYIFDGEYLLVSEDGANLLARVTPIAFSVSGKVWVNNHAHILSFDEKATQTFIELYLNSISLENYVTGSAQPKLNQANLNSIKIPLPPLDVQQEIVARIEREQELVNANKELIKIFGQKIKDEIGKLWEV
jgi:type I restriction enzyme M protein